MFVFRGDVGAGDSDFVWNAGVFFNYRFTKSFSMLAGCRWLDYDYQTGGDRNRFAYDATYEDPAVAMSFTGRNDFSHFLKLHANTLYRVSADEETVVTGSIRS